VPKFNFTGSYINAGGKGHSKEAQLRLAVHPNPAVRRRLAENPETASEVLAKLADDPEPEVRAGLAWNKAVTNTVLERLCQDPDVDVRLALTENHQLPGSVLAVLAEDENPYVKRAAQGALEILELEAYLEAQRFCIEAGLDARLGQVLVAADKVDASALAGFLETAQTRSEPLGHVLIRDGGLSKHLVGKALMLQFSVRNGAVTLEQAVEQLKEEQA